MKFVSLFAGVGGFDLALERLGHECVYANEWDKYAVQTYEKNFCSRTNGNTDGRGENDTAGNDEKGQGLESKTGKDITNEKRHYGKHGNCGTGKGASCIDSRDITTVPESEIPDHELLVGGFPCQAFSIAGKRRGFDDTRGTLFFEIARILRAKKPRLFILENVKGLLSHDNGRTFKTIISTLTELGYDLEWQVLNSKNFGVPQNRERVFIVGHIRGTPRPKVFPITENNSKDIVLPTITTRIEALSNGTYVGKRQTQESEPSGQGSRQEWIKPDHSNNIRRATYTDDMRIRKLTPLECERLQGFPDNWTEGVSDTQRYKQMGNAVTVNVVYEIAKLL